MPLYSSWQADANWEKRHLRPGHRKAAGMASSAGTARSMELASSSGLVHHGPAVAHRSAVPGTRGPGSLRCVLQHRFSSMMVYVLKHP